MPLLWSARTWLLSTTDIHVLPPLYIVVRMRQPLAQRFPLFLRPVVFLSHPPTPCITLLVLLTLDANTNKAGEGGAQSLTAISIHAPSGARASHTSPVPSRSAVQFAIHLFRCLRTLMHCRCPACLLSRCLRTLLVYCRCPALAIMVPAHLSILGRSRSHSTPTCPKILLWSDMRA